MKNKQHRWYLQIRFKNNGDPFFLKSWCINDSFANIKECEKMAEGLLDQSVESMRIVDKAKDNIYKQYR